MSPLGKRPRGKGGADGSPKRIVGLGGCGDKRPNPGGAYMGPKLTDLAKTFQEAQAGHTESATTGTEHVMATWKRKEREWAAGQGEGVSDGKKLGDGGDEGKVKNSKKGHMTAISTEMANGSRLVEAEIQPHRPQ